MIRAPLGSALAIASNSMPTLSFTEEMTARELSQIHNVPLSQVRADMIAMRERPTWELREIAGQQLTLKDRLARWFHYRFK